MHPAQFFDKTNGNTPLANIARHNSSRFLRPGLDVVVFAAKGVNFALDLPHTSNVCPE